MRRYEPGPLGDPLILAAFALPAILLGLASLFFAWYYG